MSPLGAWHLNGHSGKIERMAHFKVVPSSIQGEITIPPSKSHTLRAILFGAFAEGTTRIANYLSSPDALAMIQACRLVGAKIAIHNHCLEIEGIAGNVRVFEDVIQAGNSGIVLRFLAAIAALSSHYTVITGDESIRHKRPVKALLDGLQQLGALAISTRGDDFAPVIIRGPLLYEEVELDGKDSQPVSALLIAAALRKAPTKIRVRNPGEKPWIDMTLHWFDLLGIPYQRREYELFEIPGHTKIKSFDYTVPGDLSSAAFPLAAAVVTGSEVTLQNIDMQDIQGDKAFISLLQQVGAPIEIDALSKSLKVRPGSSLNGAEVDINHFIDALPIMAAVACFATSETRIVNAGVAREKESDRLHVMATELKKMGATIQELPEGLVIQPSKLRGAALSSHNDHRVAMALTVAALGAEGNSTIHQTDCVSKTFPDFAQALQSLGVNIESVE